MNRMENEFVSWLNRELQGRDWSQRELARRAGLSQTTVSQVLSYQRNPTPEFCIDVARGLRVPADHVLRRAGHLPPRPSTPISDVPRLQHLAERVAALPEERQRVVIDAFLALLEIQEAEPETEREST